MSAEGAAERGRRLKTWKEIAAFFDRDERTVKRWEATRGLPVRRVPNGGAFGGLRLRRRTARVAERGS